MRRPVSEFPSCGEGGLRDEIVRYAWTVVSVWVSWRRDGLHKGQQVQQEVQLIKESEEGERERESVRERERE